MINYIPINWTDLFFLQINIAMDVCCVVWVCVFSLLTAWCGKITPTLRSSAEWV